MFDTLASGSVTDHGGYVHEFYQLQGNQYNQLFGYECNHNHGTPCSILQKGSAVACAHQQFQNERVNRAYLSINMAIDINASTETVYPRINNNSMNKKLEAAKKYLKERNK